MRGVVVVHARDRRTVPPARTAGPSRRRARRKDDDDDDFGDDGEEKAKIGENSRVQDMKRAAKGKMCTGVVVKVRDKQKEYEVKYDDGQTKRVPQQRIFIDFV